MNRSIILVLVLAGCGGSAKTAPAPNVAGPTSPAPSAEPTTGEAVIEASIAAQGGRDRMSKITSMKQTGVMSLPQMGMKGTMTILSAAPRNMLTTVELKGFGKMMQGVSDGIAWEHNAMTGARVMAGSEERQLLRESTFNADLAWKELYAKADLEGVVDFHGTQAYKLVMTAKDGDTQTRYFAKNTLLPLGVEMTIESQMGKMPGELSLSDYREVNGIKHAFKLVQKAGPQTIEMVIEAIEHGPAIPAGTFDLPPEIQAIRKK